MIAGIAIFLGTYLVLAVGRLPPFRMDRTGAAVIGASLMVGLNVLTLEEAYAAVNHDTILLLFGMMIVVANLRLSGVFAAISEWVVEHTRGPVTLLAAIVIVAGIFSAFFVNDTICIVLTPLVLEITRSSGRNPVPYLLAVAMGSNIGSVATITGNPQNMMIGSFSGISYGHFFARLAPVAGIGLLATVAVLWIFYRRQLRIEGQVTPRHRVIRINRMLMYKSVVASIGMIVLFFGGWPVPKVALVTGGLLLITRRVKPQKIYREIDWPLLVLFIGLFIVIAGVEKAALTEEMEQIVAQFRLESVAMLSVAAAVLSNLVSNVPAVLVFKPFIRHLTDPDAAWLTLAMSSTLAGNLTVLGSIANLIVVQRARREGVEISFAEYLKSGAIVTAVTIAIGVLFLR
ncbi:MAG: anion transporter [Acidobacteria bacterium]|nr:anion transporter [Acidobacteriota bacterium]